MTSKNNELYDYARIEVFNGPLAGKVFRLDKELIIGRQDQNASASPNPDISLPDNRVSRRHARVLINKGDYSLEDLNSTNGTFLNGHNVALRGPVMIREGNNVQVGETHLRFFPASVPEHDENKRASSPWQSEIGLNEQAFDFSKPTNSNDDT